MLLLGLGLRTLSLVPTQIPLIKKVIRSVSIDPLRTHRPEGRYVRFRAAGPQLPPRRASEKSTPDHPADGPPSEGEVRNKGPLRRDVNRIVLVEEGHESGDRGTKASSPSHGRRPRSRRLRTGRGRRDAPQNPRLFGRTTPIPRVSWRHCPGSPTDTPVNTGPCFELDDLRIGFRLYAIRINRHRNTGGATGSNGLRLATAMRVTPRLDECLDAPESCQDPARPTMHARSCIGSRSVAQTSPQDRHSIDDRANAVMETTMTMFNENDSDAGDSPGFARTAPPPSLRPGPEDHEEVDDEEEDDEEVRPRRRRPRRPRPRRPRRRRQRSPIRPGSRPRRRRPRRRSKKTTSRAASSEPETDAGAETSEAADRARRGSTSSPRRHRNRRRSRRRWPRRPRPKAARTRDGR